MANLNLKGPTFFLPYRNTGCPKGRGSIQIQISALIQTTYCIQFQRMQFHVIKSFPSYPMCIKLCVVKGHYEFQSTTISCLN
jgi:hypothetical protein